MDHSARYSGFARHPVSRQTSPRPVPRPAGGALVWNPFGSVRRDPKLNSRRPEVTLGQTRPARQGLVRVPESNTKYGGKVGKTGGDPAPVMGQVSVSPQGFPRQKICCRVWKEASPRCSQGRYFLHPGDCTGETHVRLRSGRAGMSAHPWSRRRISGKVRADSIAFSPFAGLHDRIKTHRAGADRARRPDVPRRHLGGLGV